MEEDDLRYQLCKVCGAKDCDCTMMDWVMKLQAENEMLRDAIKQNVYWIDAANEKMSDQAKELEQLKDWVSGSFDRKLLNRDQPDEVIEFICYNINRKYNDDPVSKWLVREVISNLFYAAKDEYDRRPVND